MPAPSTKGSSTVWGCRPSLVVCVALAANTVLLCAFGFNRSTKVSSTVALAGQYEDIHGTEVVWQLPGSQHPKGVLLAFHGCSHGAIDWWPSGAACPTCIGLPEEVAITTTALSRGYAVVAISSRDRHHRRCWAIPQQPNAQTVDTTSAVAVVTALQQREGLKGLPMYAVGASSGGAFALALAAHLPLSALCSQIMALPASWYQAYLEEPPAAQQQSQRQWAPPPVLFVHMPRDTHTAARVKESMELRHSKGLITQVIEVPPQPITQQLLSRIPELQDRLAQQQLIKLFKAKGVINGAGVLQQDPRQSDWRAVVKQSGVAGLSNLTLTPDQSGLSEVMNVAFASHEIISDTTAEMLDWFEKQPVA